MRKKRDRFLEQLNARRAAARASTQKPISEMDEDELTAEIERLRGELRGASAQDSRNPGAVLKPGAKPLFAGRSRRRPWE